MADDTTTISFNNDLFTDARGDTATYTGTIDVDYTTNSFSGNVKVKGQTRGFGAGFNFSGGLSSEGGGYTIAGNNFTLSYTGQRPTTASAEFVLNNNEDYETSLNPASQRAQPVSASGGTGSGTTGGSTTGGGTTGGGTMGGGTTGGGTTGGGTTGGGTTGGGTTGGSDVTATISFDSDLFTDKRGDKATYTGAIKVDYTTGTYSGNVKIKGRGLGAGIGLSGHLAINGSTYTISQSNFTFSYTGQRPTTATAEFVANNNQDFRTSLNPSGQRNQPVSSSGDAGTTQAARTDAASTAAMRHVVDAAASEQTLHSGAADIFANHGAPSNTFVFDPGYGNDVVRMFRANGGDHDTLSLAGSDFGNSIAEVLRHTRDAGDGVVIADPTSRDTVRLPGVSKAELVHNAGDFAFHR